MPNQSNSLKKTGREKNVRVHLVRSVPAHHVHDSCVTPVTVLQPWIDLSTFPSTIMMVLPSAISPSICLRDRWALCGFRVLIEVKPLGMDGLL